MLRSDDVKSEYFVKSKIGDFSNITSILTAVNCLLHWAAYLLLPNNSREKSGFFHLFTR